MKKYVINISLLLLLSQLISAFGCNKNDAAPPPSPDTGTVKDAEGNVYKTIKIGTQIWMAENLKATKYRNGDAITFAGSKTSWGNLIVPKLPGYCNDKDDPSTATEYGRLYNWYAVTDSRGLAPAGWHVPTLDEWQALMDFLGGKPVAGGKMKEAGTTHWPSPNTEADNSSGFTALYTGSRLYDGNFRNGTLTGGYYTYWWSATTTEPANTNPDAKAQYAFVWSKGGTAYTNGDIRNTGLSVRCVKD